MKYIVVLADGMADRPIPSLGNITPLEKASTPAFDRAASCGVFGMVRTIPEGMAPGSDTANMAVMGSDPAVFYSGRSPLEALSMGIDLSEDDITYRMNLVTLSAPGPDGSRTMEDYSAGEITTEEAGQLVKALAEKVHTDAVDLYAGISYRHCLVLHGKKSGAILTPPHDITGKPVEPHLPRGESSALLNDIMARAREVFADHPVNLSRRRRGLREANAVWFWGEGKKPHLRPFQERYGVRGAVVCAVDLIKGLGIGMKMDAPFVPGATGGMTTDYASKAGTALSLLRNGYDFVYVHIEAPDESGHHGNIRAKINAIEAIDSEIVDFLDRELRKAGEHFRMLICPDHPTPIECRTHTSDTVPFVIYDSEDTIRNAVKYSEKNAAATGLFVPHGYELMPMLIRK